MTLRLLTLSALAAALTLLPGTASAKPVPPAMAFSGAAAVGHPPTAGQTTTGDVNDDSFQDIVVSDVQAAVILGNGDGTFQAERRYFPRDPATLNGASLSGPIVVADIDRDGHDDLVAVGRHPQSAHNDGVFVLPGELPPPQFPDFPEPVDDATFVAVSGSPFAVALSDVNNDGRLDLLVAGNQPAELTVLLQNGLTPALDFLPQVDYQAAADPTSLAIGDLDADGTADVVVGAADAVSILLGNADGTFRPKSDVAITGQATAVAIGDLTLDEIPDLVVGTSHDGASVLGGNGDGTFQSAQAADGAGATEVNSVAIADLNLDGRADLALGISLPSAVALLPGRGDGSFPDRTDLTLGSDGSPAWAAVANLDGTGGPDIAATSGGGLVFLNQRAPDPEPTIFIGDGGTSVTEGDTGTTKVTIPVYLSQPSSSATQVRFSYATEPDVLVDQQFQAAEGEDYLPKSRTVTFGPRQVETQIELDVVGDLRNEDDEAFFVTLHDVTGAQAGDVGGFTGLTVVQVFDNDPPPTISLTNPTVTEGDTGTTTATFTASLSQASGRRVSVHYATSDRTATTADYGPWQATLDFGPGETTKTFGVDVFGDCAAEQNETFAVELTNPVNATIADDPGGVGTIVDDDGQLPTISVDDAGVTEGDAATKNAHFTITASKPLCSPVSFDYTTADGSAKAPADYTTRAGQGTIAAGETTTAVDVPVRGDTIDEPDQELFTVELSNPHGATLDDHTGVGTITDDDPPPIVSIDDAAAIEGTSASFTVHLSQESGKTVTVVYSTADDSATSASDYAETSGSLTFLPGETAMTVTVDIASDCASEPGETFAVDLSNPSNATIGDGRGVGTIGDEGIDPPRLSIDDVTVTEGSDVETSTATFTVSATDLRCGPVTVDYATADGTATAQSLIDYIPTRGHITLGASTNATVAVTVIGDALDEPDESFEVRLTNAQNAEIADDVGVGTITDDDPPPKISISDASATEGGLALFDVTLSQQSGKTVMVDLTTADGTARDGADYDTSVGFPHPTLVITPGTLVTAVRVALVGDVLPENDETFTVNLSNARNADIDDGQATGLIVDDDLPALSINDIVVNEGDTGTTPAVFTVTLTEPSERPITVGYGTTGTAVGADVVLTSGTLEFGPGETSKQLTVDVIGDTLAEPDEIFTVELSHAVGARIIKPVGGGTIIDNDTVNTPVGQNVTVDPIDPTTATRPVTITFANVSQAGFTTVVSSPSPSPAPAIPGGFQVDGAFYELSTTAVFSSATVCFPYTGTGFANVLHFTGGVWVALQPVASPFGQVCVVVTSFSPFVVALDIAPPAISATVTPAPNANAWNNTDVKVTFTCSDGGSGIATCPAAVTVSAEGANQAVTRAATDKAGNTAAATATVSIDKTKPTVKYTGNAGSYGLLDTVSIVCSASDALSKLASSTCADTNGPAWTFGAGPHALAATATDKAGNAGSAATSFTVVVTTAGLCQLTRQFVQSSAKYQALKPAQKVAVDALTNALCDGLAAIVPKLTPAQKATLVAAYKKGVDALVPLAWLTANQAATLKQLANSI